MTASESVTEPVLRGSSFVLLTVFGIGGGGDEGGSGGRKRAGLRLEA